MQILVKKRDEAKRAADNIVKAIEQGIIMDFTKDRLAALQEELNKLDIEINKESQKTYAHVTVEDVEKYLLSKVFEDPDDIKTRKLLVNTFIRDILWYGDHIVITYNFQEYAATDRFCKSYVEQLEKQVGEASRSASSFSLCSYKFRHSAPIKMRTEGFAFFIWSGLDRQNLPEHGRAVCALHARADMQGRYIKPYCALAVRQVLSSAPIKMRTEGFAFFIWSGLDRQNLPEHGRAVCALHARADMQGRYIKPYCALAVRQVLSSAPNKNNTNPRGNLEFVLFFTRDFFGIIVKR